MIMASDSVRIVSTFIVLEFANFFYQIHSIGTILQHPQSRLVPVDVGVSFTCVIRDGFNPHWVINRKALDSIERINRAAAAEGYVIRRQESRDHNIFSLSLMFNATMEKNGTRIYCSSFTTHSNVAVLLVMSETPLVQNPFITNPNKSSILLKWSPPFLWPGSVIDHYNISVIAAVESDKIFYRVNATFSDDIVSFLKTSDDSTEIRHCNEILFSISAVADHGTELASFTVAGGYLPNVVNLTLDDVNITVLFESDGSPIVIINIKLPLTICNYQLMKYSVFIESSGKVFQDGPYQQYGPKSIRKSIASNLEMDTSYTLMVAFDTQAGIFYSQQYSFSTSLWLDDHDHMNCSISLMTNTMEVFVYKVVMGAFLGVTVVILLLIFITSLCVICQRKLKRTAPLPNSTNRVFNAMTHNPIYDGPVYDSIVQSQFDTLPTNKKVSTDGQIMLHLSGPSCPDESDDDSGSVSPKRYVQQSSQAKTLLSTGNSTCTSSSPPSSDIVNASECIASSQSVSTANNKVLDTLPSYSECTSDDVNLRINETPKFNMKQTVLKELQSEDDEDSKYTVMTPIGANAFSHDNGYGQLN